MGAAGFEFSGVFGTFIAVGSLPAELGASSMPRQRTEDGRGYGAGFHLIDVIGWIGSFQTSVVPFTPTFFHLVPMLHTSIGICSSG